MSFSRSLALLVGICALSLAVACERKETAAPAGATGDIVIGMYGSLTGDGASFGQSSKEGTELAVEEINNKGGLLGGRKLRLLVEDDQSKPEEASSAVTKLITQNKVIAVLGEVASRRSLAAAPVAQKYQIPMITPSSTNERVTEVGDYIFRVCFIDPFQGEVLAKFAYNDLKARRVAILKDIGQDYSVGLTDSISKFKDLGGEVLPPVNYSSTDADFKAILTQVRAQKPDAIFATGYYPEAAIIVRQAREIGLQVPILGGDGWVGDALKNGREALNNTYISNHYSADNPDPVVQEFVTTYRKRFGGKEPDSIAALAYDAVKVLADAITRAQSTEGPKVRDALAAADVAGVTGRLKMNAKRNVDKPAVIQAVTYGNGEVKFVYKTTVNPS
jgi:branched-chain amino acid transport system substrate-binding protein